MLMVRRREEQGLSHPLYWLRIPLTFWSLHHKGKYIHVATYVSVGYLSRDNFPSDKKWTERHFQGKFRAC